jgi:hypothetical protein
MMKRKPLVKEGNLKYGTRKQIRRSFKRKNYYSKVDSSSLDEEDDSGNDTRDVLFMDFDNYEEEGYELEGEIDLRDELICALE